MLKEPGHAQGIEHVGARDPFAYRKANDLATEQINGLHERPHPFLARPNAVWP